MKRTAAILLCSLAILASALPSRPAGAEALWRDWDAGLKEAQATGRPVIVDVYTDWCGWCKRMDRDVYARRDVRDYLSRHFVAVKLDAEAGQAASYEGKRYTTRTLASGRFRINSYPTTVFLNSNGDHLANVPGYLPPERFLLLLRYIGDGHLDRGVSFDQFVKSSGVKLK